LGTRKERRRVWKKGEELPFGYLGGELIGANRRHYLDNLGYYIRPHILEKKVMAKTGFKERCRLLEGYPQRVRGYILHRSI